MTDIIKFNKIVGGIYGCDASGDQSGEYVRAEEMDQMAKDLLRNAGLLNGIKWLRASSEPALRAVAYLESRGLIERHPHEDEFFRWLTQSAREEER